ncbi:YadA-like family protein [Xanthomonas sp. NCPPB 2632]|uniref:YadA-like family protein n=1 Tax=Xanthomonas sp. NCPPB 2632 TaxID=3240912 RepID=UPI003512CD8E
MSFPNRRFLLGLLALAPLSAFAQTFAAPVCDGFFCATPITLPAPVIDPESTNSVAVGPGATIRFPSALEGLSGGESAAFGAGATVIGIGSNSFGAFSQALASDAVANGWHATAKSNGAIAIGSQSQAGDPVLYPGNQPNGVVGAQIAIGDQSQAVGGSSVVVGPQASADGMFGTAIGAGSHADGFGCLALGSGSVCTQQNTAALGNRRITGILYGQDNFDGAAVGQLRQVTNGFGAGAGVDAGGNFQSPQFVLSGGTYSDVNSALLYLDGRFNDIGTGPGQPGEAGPQGPKGDQGVAGPPGAGNGRDDAAVHYDTRADGSTDTGNVTLQGQGGTGIHNLRAGVATDDAANVGQVQQGVADAKNYADKGDARTLNWANSYTDARIAAMSHVLNRRIAQAGAVGSVMGSMALSAGSVQQQSKLSMGAAGYRGQSAIGLAYTYRFENERVAVAVGGAFSGEGSAVAVSVSVGIGQ